MVSNNIIYIIIGAVALVAVVALIISIFALYRTFRDTTTDTSGDAPVVPVPPGTPPTGTPTTTGITRVEFNQLIEDSIILPISTGGSKISVTGGGQKYEQLSSVSGVSLASTIDSTYEVISYALDSLGHKFPGVRLGKFTDVVGTSFNYFNDPVIPTDALGFSLDIIKGSSRVAYVFVPMQRYTTDQLIVIVPTFGWMKY